MGAVEGLQEMSIQTSLPKSLPLLPWIRGPAHSLPMGVGTRVCPPCRRRATPPPPPGTLSWDSDPLMEGGKSREGVEADTSLQWLDETLNRCPFLGSQGLPGFCPLQVASSPFPSSCEGRVLAVNSVVVRAGICCSPPRHQVLLGKALSRALPAQTVWG